MQIKRPSYQWETHLIRTATARADAVVTKPLRSCLKKSSNQDLLDKSQYSLDGDQDFRGHDSLPSAFDDESARGMKRVPRPRRPSKTRSLDADVDVLFGSMRRSESSAGVTKVSSSASSEGNAENKVVRRQRRRRSSRLKDPTLANGAKPVVGILRTSSEPPRYQVKKQVSFSDLDRCRWHSQGSSLNVQKSVARKACSDGEGDGIRGNFVWEKKTESKVRSVMKSESLNGIHRLLKEEVNRQAPSRPVRRSSNESESSAKESSSPTNTSRKARRRSSREKRKGSKQKASATANVFEASVGSFQTAVHRSHTTKPTDSTAQAPSLPRRSNSMDDSTGENVSKAVTSIKSTSEGKQAPPSLPIRRSSMEHDTSPPPPPVNPFQAQVNDFQVSIRSSMLATGSKGQAPAMPSRRSSMEHDTSPPEDNFKTKAKATNLQCPVLGSIPSKEFTGNSVFEELADHSIAA